MDGPLDPTAGDESAGVVVPVARLGPGIAAETAVTSLTGVGSGGETLETAPTVGVRVADDAGGE